MTDNTSSPLEGGKIGGPSVLTYEPERYRSAVTDLDLTDDQRDQLLSTLWSIMQNMVELGYSIADSKICESILGPFIEATNSPAGTVESSQDDEVSNEEE